MEVLIFLGVIALFTLINRRDKGPVLSDIEVRSPPPPAPKPQPADFSTIPTWQSPCKTSYVDYEAYIKSPAWKFNESRIATLREDNYSCNLCKGIDNVAVHHIHYDNLGRESQDQLITLCQPCHQHTHLVAGKGAKLYPPIRKP